MHKISSKLTLTETFNLGYDIDFEHSNSTFSLDTSLLMMIYTQIEFGCKRLTGLELIKDIVEMMMMKWCLMSSDVSWHIRDKLWPMPKHGSIIFYVHGNHKAR